MTNTQNGRVMDRDQLLEDLLRAYMDARKHKRNSHEHLRFSLDLESNLLELCDSILTRSYQPRPSICFIVNDPVKREVFAAAFRDRIVHHLIYNYVNPVFEEFLIDDSYSCRKKRGTLYGIRRLDWHIRSCSSNYSKSCYVLKLDIKGYFMHINKQKLMEKLEYYIMRYRSTDVSSSDVRDWEMIQYLIRVTVMNDPRDGCVFRSPRWEWKGLSPSKSMFHSREGCGLPIGNLTSQLFSNVYLHSFDEFVVKEHGLIHYGRYVDDFYVVHPDRIYLRKMIGVFRDYLSSELGLELHPQKVHLQHYSKGVRFLGAVVKPGRLYSSKRLVGRFKLCISETNKVLSADLQGMSEEDFAQMIVKTNCRINSYLGLLRHYRAQRLLHRLLLNGTPPSMIFRYGVAVKRGDGWVFKIRDDKARSLFGGGKKEE